MAASTQANVKATFTFDEGTIKRLADASVRLARPRSEIVREAINEFYARLDRLTDAEQESMLQAFDTLLPQVNLRPREETDLEIREIRSARRRGGRQSPALP